jgi:holo-[acyl-carrier protein] synthase
MLGIDLCSARRIRRLCERYGDSFSARVFTAGERRHAGARRDPYPSLAARWAAKEAVVKILGRARGFTWYDVEVVDEGGGRPGIRLAGATEREARRRDLGRWHVSITHEGDLAACVVLAVHL